MPPVFAEPMGMTAGTPYDRENYGSFLTPALQVAAVDLIEAIQALQLRDPRGAAAPEFSVKMDSAAIQARQIVQKWMERDRPC